MIRQNGPIFFWDGLVKVSRPDGYVATGVHIAMAAHYAQNGEFEFLSGTFNVELSTPSWDPERGDAFAFDSTESWSSIGDVNSSKNPSTALRVPSASITYVDESGIANFVTKFAEWTDENGSHSIGSR